MLTGDAQFKLVVKVGRLDFLGLICRLHCLGSLGLSFGAAKHASNKQNRNHERMPPCSSASTGEAPASTAGAGMKSPIGTIAKPRIANSKI